MTLRTRSRSPAKTKTEQSYPVHIRILVPELGFGQRSNQMQDWLRNETGGDYAWHADSLPGVDAVKVYLKNPQTVERLLAEFGLELAHL